MATMWRFTKCPTFNVWGVHCTLYKDIQKRKRNQEEMGLQHKSLTIDSSCKHFNLSHGQTAVCTAELVETYWDLGAMCKALLKKQNIVTFSYYKNLPHLSCRRHHIPLLLSTGDHSCSWWFKTSVFTKNFPWYCRRRAGTRSCCHYGKFHVNIFEMSKTNCLLFTCSSNVQLI